MTEEPLDFDWDFAEPATPEWDLALAASGDEAFGGLLRRGIPDALDQAIAELASFPR